MLRRISAFRQYESCNRWMHLARLVSYPSYCTWTRIQPRRRRWLCSASWMHSPMSITASSARPPTQASSSSSSSSSSSKTSSSCSPPSSASTSTPSLPLTSRPPPLYPYQKTGVAWMKQREQLTNPVGGILADEMGLGKTVQMAAVLKELAEARTSAASVSGTDRPMRRLRPTLVVAPKSLQHQWVEEIQRFAPSLADSICVYTHTGAATRPELLRAAVVLVTYELLRRELVYVPSKRLLLCIPWERVVLDEAHMIRNPDTANHKSTYELKADIRWCLAGTPMINRLEDLAALCRFLRCHPQDNVRWWYRGADTSSSSSCTSTAIQEMNAWRERVILRRTKAQVLKLPPLTGRRVTVRLTAVESEAYDQLLTKAELDLDRLERTGAQKIVMYRALFVWLLRLRQLSSDWRLLEQPQALGVLVAAIPLFSDDNKAAIDKAYQSATHSISLENSDDSTSMAPDHESDDDNDDDKSESPSTASAAISMVDEEWHDTSFSSSNGNRDPKPTTHVIGSKIQMVAHVLGRVLREAGTTKVLVYSQWTRCLDLIQAAVQWDQKTQMERYDGSMLDAERQKRLSRFRTDATVRVLLISLHAGGLGLNLQEANTVFLVDQWFNAAVEDQAICRTHRIGQHHPVTVYRFVADTSIEDCMLVLKKRKQQTANVCVDGASGLPYAVLQSVFTELIRKRKAGAEGTENIEGTESTKDTKETVHTNGRRRSRSPCDDHVDRSTSAMEMDDGTRPRKKSRPCASTALTKMERQPRRIRQEAEAMNRIAANLRPVEPMDKPVGIRSS